MKRFVLAAALAMLAGSQADAQYVYSYPSYYYSGGNYVVPSNYYYQPATTSYYSPGVVTSSYYTPAYTYGSGYYSSPYGYSSGYIPNTYISPRTGVIGGPSLALVGIRLEAIARPRLNPRPFR